MSEIPQLRPYQAGLVSKIRSGFVKYKHVLAVLPTAGGKTFCFSYIVASAYGKGYSILVLSNRAKLLSQSGGSLVKFGLTPEYITAAHQAIPAGRCVVAMAQTLQRRYMKPDWNEYLKSVDMLIIDEIHIQDFNFILESGLFDKKWILGVTATPFRKGKQRQLGLDFEVLIEGASVPTLIELGYIVPARHFTLDAPDLSTVGINPIDGDYLQGDMYRTFNSPKIYNGVISEYKRLGNNDKTICFCCNQTHAIKTCLAFNEAGIKSMFVVSGMKKTDEDYHIYEDNQQYTGKQEAVLYKWEHEDVQVLVNVAIFTTGADFPFIINVILNRATLSEALFRQMLGRGCRTFEGKDSFRVFDFGDNIKRHGLFEKPLVAGLWHEIAKEGSGVVMSKECPTLETDCEGKHGCGRLIHISYPKCCFCGYIFKTKEEERTIELTEIIGGEFKFKNMSATQLKAFAELNGRSMGWVWRLLWIGNNEGDFRKGLRELGYDNKFIYRQMMIYKSEDAKKAKDLLIKEQNKLAK